MDFISIVVVMTAVQTASGVSFERPKYVERRGFNETECAVAQKAYSENAIARGDRVLWAKCEPAISPPPAKPLVNPQDLKDLL